MSYKADATAENPCTACRAAAHPAATGSLPYTAQMPSSLISPPALPVSACHTPAPAPDQHQLPPLSAQPGLSLQPFQHPFPSALGPPSLAPPSSLTAPSLALRRPAYMPATQSAVPGTDPFQTLTASSLGPAGLVNHRRPLPEHLGKPWNSPMHSLPLYTADSYSLKTGSLPVCSTWPLTSIPAVAPSATMPIAVLPQLAGDPLQLDPKQCVMSKACSDDGSSVDSDPAALVEDALLGELFFAQPEASQVQNIASSPTWYTAHQPDCDNAWRLAN